MKNKTTHRKLDHPMRERCVLIGRFVAVSILAAMGLGAVQAGSEPGPLGSKPGWYSLDSGRRLLLVPSAKGGLYVADFDAATSSRMEESGTRGWGWHVGDSAELQIRFQVAGAETLGFEWREEGRARQARKDRDPVYT
ncbi:MAG: hypothetical protein O7A04_04675, partial [Acidobacteria bacterium]|nr:hypothetical protein [Acidobacteriota bacterium]